MRWALVVLVVFVVLYACVATVGARRHSSEQTPAANNRPQLPSSLNVNWGLFPDFLKVQVADVSIVGTATGPRSVAIAPYGTAFFKVLPSSLQYRMMRVSLDGGSSVAPLYPAITSPAPSQTPDPLTAGAATQTVVLPQAGGMVSLRCLGPGSCAVSY